MKNLRISLCLTALLACTNITAQTAGKKAAKFLNYPNAGTYKLVEAVYDESGRKVPVNGNKYRVHVFGGACGTLWIDDKTVNPQYPIEFTYRKQMFNFNDPNCYLTACTDSSYTQRWHKYGTYTPWQSETWQRTVPDDIARSILNTLTDHDISRRIYGTYYADSGRVALYLTKDYAIVGHSDNVMLDGVFDEYTYFTGSIFKVSYPSDYQFTIAGRTYTVDSTAFDSRYFYSLAHPIDIGGNGKKYERIYKGTKNGFYTLLTYVRNGIAVEYKDKEEGDMICDYLSETADSVHLDVQDDFTVSKSKARMVSRSAAAGQGWVYSIEGFTPVRPVPDDKAAAIDTLITAEGDMPYGMECLGIEGNWYRVKVVKDGKTQTGYARRDEAWWATRAVY